MGRFQFLTFLLVSALLLSISLPQGYGRRIKVMKRYDAGHTFKPSVEKALVERVTEEMEEDYKEPGPNTNPKSSAPPSPDQPH